MNFDLLGTTIFYHEKVFQDSNLRDLDFFSFQLSLAESFSSESSKQPSSNYSSRRVSLFFLKKEKNAL